MPGPKPDPEREHSPHARARRDLPTLVPDDHTAAFAEIGDGLKRAWLACYATHGNKRRAAIDVGIEPVQIYKPSWAEDEEFQAAVERARVMSVDYLESVALKRATEGLVRYKFHSRTGEPLRHPEQCECGAPRWEHIRTPEGELTQPETGCHAFVGIPYVEHEYSDRLLETLLRAHGDRYKDKLEVSGVLKNMDMTKLPPAVLVRLTSGEDPMAVLAGFAEEVLGALSAGPQPGELVQEETGGHEEGAPPAGDAPLVSEDQEEVDPPPPPPSPGGGL